MNKKLIIAAASSILALASTASADNLDIGGLGAGIGGVQSMASITAGTNGVNRVQMKATNVGAQFIGIKLTELDSTSGSLVTEMDGFELLVVNQSFNESDVFSKVSGNGNGAISGSADAGGLSGFVYAFDVEGDIDW